MFKIKKTYEDGSTTVINLDGEEIILSTCPICGREHELEFEIAVGIIADAGVDVSVHCDECRTNKN